MQGTSISSNGPHPLRVVVKALLIVALINGVYAWASWRAGGELGFGALLAAQKRFPIYVRDHSEQTPSRFGIQNVFDLKTLFWSHAISREPKPDSEYRVFLLGDSTVRDSAIAEDLSAAGLSQCGRKQVRVYSLGYYGPSVLKDLIILQEAMQYKPDLLVWFFEQEALLGEPKAFARNNPVQLAKLARRYGLPGPGRARQADVPDNWYSQTLLGQRERFSLQARLMLDDGILRTGLGSSDGDLTKQVISEVSAAAMTTNDPAWKKIADSYGELRPTLPPHPQASDYLFRALVAGRSVARPIPIIFLNEPVNRGMKDWQYDPAQYARYSRVVSRVSSAQGWTLLNLWDLIPASDFLDRIHHGPPGDKLVEQRLAPAILGAPCTPQAAH